MQKYYSLETEKDIADLYILEILLHGHGTKKTVMLTELLRTSED